MWIIYIYIYNPFLSIYCTSYFSIIILFVLTIYGLALSLQFLISAFLITSYTTLAHINSSYIKKGSFSVAHVKWGPKGSIHMWEMPIRSKYVGRKQVLSCKQALCTLSLLVLCLLYPHLFTYCATLPKIISKMTKCKSKCKCRAAAGWESLLFTSSLLPEVTGTNISLSGVESLGLESHVN